MSNSADYDHETSSNADSSFSCTDCRQEFKSIQGLKEYKSNHNKFNLK